MVIGIGLSTAEEISLIAKRAGHEIMKVYKTGFTAVLKTDHTPVTKADQIAEEIIIHAIREGITSKWPIVAEESISKGKIPKIEKTPFWLVDPLDGTKEFIKRNNEFTVNIALIDNEEPILGIVHAPAKNISYIGFKDGVFLQKGDEDGVAISVRTPPKNGLTAVLSNSHANAKSVDYLKNYHLAKTTNTGSSLKFCMIAEGSADIYPRFGPTMEWDTAAGHAILKFAGGNVLTTAGTPLKYGKNNFKNPYFIALSPDYEQFINK